MPARSATAPVVGPAADSGSRPLPGSQTLPHRTLADAPSLQALTHPTRLALMEAVGVHGMLTATQTSALVGESPAACAYHLCTLALLGFLEEAGRGRGRVRPWRLAQAGLSIADDSDDPGFAAAGQALATALTERYITRIRAFELARSRYADDIRAVTGTEQGVVFGTPAELAELREQIGTLLRRYADRADPARRPPRNVPFEVIAFVHVLDVGATQGGPGAQPEPDAGSATGPG